MSTWISSSVNPPALRQWRRTCSTFPASKTRRSWRIKKPYNLSEQIRRCILLLQSAWEHKNIQLEIDLEEVEICANEEMLSQVWVNLLDNAIKFSHEGGRIVFTLQKTDDIVEAVLRDYGPGIGEKDISHIFDKFYQADSSRAISGNRSWG